MQSTSCKTQFSSFLSTLTSFSRSCSPYGSFQQLQASIFLVLIARSICKSLSFSIILVKIPVLNCIPITELVSVISKWKMTGPAWVPCKFLDLLQGVSSTARLRLDVVEGKGKGFEEGTSSQCPLSILSLSFSLHSQKCNKVLFCPFQEPLLLPIRK